MFKKIMNHWPVILSIMALACIVGFTYQQAYLDYARRDQIILMQERYYFPDDWAWFSHLTSYNRTRLIITGDGFLFRPGLHSVLALGDIFFRDKQFLTGMISIILHLLVSVFLYLTLRKHFKGFSCFLFAAFFASQFAGIEMVLWRHISPYMLSVPGALAGILITFSNVKHKYIWASMVLFAAMLFHEIVAVHSIVFIFVLMGILLVRRPSAAQKSLVCGKTLAILGSMVFVYFISDLLNLWVIKPHSITGNSDNLIVLGNVWGIGLRSFLIYLGVVTKAVFNPYGVSLVWNNPLGFEWIISLEQQTEYFLWAAGAGVFIALTAFLSIHRALDRKERTVDLIALWACCGIVSLAFVFSLVRGVLRSEYYFTMATYYYWFFSFFYMLVLKYLIDEGLQRVRSIPFKKVITVGITLVLSIMVVGQAYKARILIKENYDLAWAQKIQQAILTAQNYFLEHPEACMDEGMDISEPRMVRLGTIPLYLKKYSCGRVPGTLKVIPVRNDDGSIRFEAGGVLFKDANNL